MNHKDIAGFRKVRFTSNHGYTAGIVMPETRFQRMNVSGLSQMFPVCEAMKMGRVQYSPVMDNYDQALYFDFDEDYGVRNVTVNPQLCRGM